MHHRRKLGLVALSLLAAFAMPASTSAQSVKELAGAWTLVSSVVEQGGNKVEPFGPNARGILIFDHNGRYSATVMRAALPKFAQENRMVATPDVYEAIALGSVTHFGTYAVDEAGKTITFRIQSSSYPNWDGTEQQRSYTLAGDELRYTASAGGIGGTATLVWKRAK